MRGRVWSFLIHRRSIDPVCGELLILGKSVIRHTQDGLRRDRSFGRTVPGAISNPVIASNSSSSPARKIPAGLPKKRRYIATSESRIGTVTLAAVRAITIIVDSPRYITHSAGFRSPSKQPRRRRSAHAPRAQPCGIAGSARCARRTRLPRLQKRAAGESLSAFSGCNA